MRQGGQEREGEEEEGKGERGIEEEREHNVKI
jgi:hypothetical protein